MPLILRPILYLVAGFALALFAGPAWAACTLAGGVTAGFGTRTSYDVRAATGGPLAVPTQFSCAKPMPGLLSGDFVSATAVSSNGFRLRSDAGDTIAYRLSADSAGTMTFSQGGTSNYLSPTLLRLPSLMTDTDMMPTMFVALIDTPNLPAGTYTDTVAVNWSWYLCRKVELLGGCTLADRDNGTTTLTVSLTVTRDCRISAPPVAFGTAPLASQFAAVTQAVAIDCTKGAAYSVSFSGRGSVTRPWRQMKGPGNSVLRYNLYRPDGTVWDEDSPLRSATAGAGTTTPIQFQPYTARIDPAQPTPAEGSYSDSISVIVSF